MVSKKPSFLKKTQSTLKAQLVTKAEINLLNFAIFSIQITNTSNQISFILVSCILFGRIFMNRFLNNITGNLWGLSVFELLNEFKVLIQVHLVH